MRRHRLLKLGVSLTEQRSTPTFELDAILAVDGVMCDYQNAEMERARKG